MKFLKFPVISLPVQFSVGVQTMIVNEDEESCQDALVRLLWDIAETYAAMKHHSLLVQPRPSRLATATCATFAHKFVELYTNFEAAYADENAVVPPFHDVAAMLRVFTPNHHRKLKLLLEVAGNVPTLNPEDTLHCRAFLKVFPVEMADLNPGKFLLS